MKRSTIIGIIISLVAIGIAVAFTYQRSLKTETPRPVDDARGSVTDTSDLIRVSYPRPNDVISSSSVTVRGQARGNWYFEASFPIVIVNWDGLIIGEGYAEAQSDWMTTDWVPFVGTVSFERPEITADNRSYARRGAIIFQKDNPSGLPQYDAALEIPIYFE